MTTTLLLLLSGLLIGTGVGLIWREMHKRPRDAFILRRDAGTETSPEPEVEITVSHRSAAAREPVRARAQAARPSSPAPSLAPAIEPRAGAALRPGTARPSATADQWAVLQPMIGAAVEQVNAVLTGAGVSIGEPEDPSWTLNRGHGIHRRILIAGESQALLRLELGAGGQVHAGIKAHKDDLAAINVSSSAPAAGLDTARISDLLSEILKPAASFAMLTASGGDAEQRSSEMAWEAVDPIVIAALQAANGAFAQAGARFVPVAGPAWDAQARRHRMTVAIEVFHADVARMQIERLAQEIEIAVGLPDARFADLGRRQRVPLQGVTTHALAELIASCAWPVIAHFRDAHRPA